MVCRRLTDKLYVKGHIKSINRCKDGNFLLAGNNIRKIDESGNTMWLCNKKLVYNNSLYRLQYNSIKSTQDSGCIAVGDDGPGFANYSISKINYLNKVNPPDIKLLN